MEGHKRSKSQLALSLLTRDKSKREDRLSESAPGTPPPESASTVSLVQTPTSASSATATSAPLSQQISPMQSTRQKQRLSNTAVAAPDGSSTSVETSFGQSGPPSSAPGRTLSIEQSVRMFRLFEALRSGDMTAIGKAIKDTSSISEDDAQDAATGTITSNGLEGTTLLHLAIQCADSQVIEYILSTGASFPGVTINVNARDRDGNTPLHLAAMLGRSTVVQLLLAQKDINDSLPNYQGRLPLDLAKTPDIFQQLQLARSLFIDAKVREVQNLVTNRDYDALKGLLEESRVQMVLDVNGAELATDPSTVQNGGTLLHEAARNKDTQLIQLLLLHGADPFRRDRKGKLPQDVTKDDRTRGILKKSPAAAAAQRGIQEKAVLGNAPPGVSGFTAPGENVVASKEAREMKGYLKKWTNYTTGYKLRWFVLEDGVLSYYKHQDDAGSACRGAINMRIARLYMDPQDKLRFEIQGKSSVKYHLKANHVVEAKRWYWALNNAIQWAKDEAREEEKRQHRDSEVLRQAQVEQAGKTQHRESDSVSIASSKLGKTLTPTGAINVPGPGGSRSTLVASSFGPESIAEEDENAIVGSYDPSFIANDLGKTISNAETANIEGDIDDEEEYGDDPSIHDLQPMNKDAFNIAAQSANLQLDLLAQISAALQTEKSRNSSLPISDPSVVKALLSYDAAVVSLKGLIGDLLKISRDRDSYWQYRLDREADIRRFWEENMARIAKEQEVLQERIGESEDKRRRTKRALKEALGSATPSAGISRRGSGELPGEPPSISEALEKVTIDKDGAAPLRRKSVSATKRRATIVDLSNISPSDSEDDDDEFFDALDAGEVEVLDKLPTIPADSRPKEEEPVASREKKKQEIVPSFKGYDEPLRKRLKLDADNRPKISLWGILKSMIGKDMTKMTLPVSFNEPTSLLQRVAEDMEYADLLDTAAERLDSTERMVYVAVFAASEYASTIGRVAKPFNPLLGETYEYARPDKGYRFFIEQVCHHPPIGAAYAESPSWDYYGESAVKSKFYGKSFDINPLGTWFLRLRPSSGGEELYTWKKVTSSVVGIITGNPTVDNYGAMEVKNWKTGDVCILDFKPRGWKASSAYQVTGKVTGADGKTRWSIGGRWNDKIYARLTPGFEDDLDRPSSASIRSNDAGSTQAFLVWQAHERPSGIPFNLTPFVLTLNAVPDSLRPYLAPTDTRLRPDQRAMEDGEYDFAAVEKNRVEEKQRKKRRDREANGEEYKPRWFTKGKCEITGEPYWVFNDEYWRMRDEVANGGGWNNVEDIF